MSSNLREIHLILQAIVTETLESAVFMVADATLIPFCAEGTEVLEARLRFGGAADGWFVLRAPRTFGNDTAAAFLGLDVDDPAAQRYSLEATGELLNMIGGKAVPAVFGSHAQIMLDVPRVKAFRPDPRLLGSPGVCRLRAFGEREHTIEVALEMRSPTAT